MRRGQKTSAEQIVLKLRQIEVQTGQGKSLALACKEAEISEQAEIQIKYEGYIKRQTEQIEKRSKLDDIKIPESIDYKKLNCLSAEAVEKLSKIRPETLGQAERISGIGSGDITMIMVYIKKGNKN